MGLKGHFRLIAISKGRIQLKIFSSKIDTFLSNHKSVLKLITLFASVLLINLLTDLPEYKIFKAYHI